MSGKRWRTERVASKHTPGEEGGMGHAITREWTVWGSTATLSPLQRHLLRSPRLSPSYYQSKIYEKLEALDIPLFQSNFSAISSEQLGCSCLSGNLNCRWDGEPAAQHSSSPSGARRHCLATSLQELPEAAEKVPLWKVTLTQGVSGGEREGVSQRGETSCHIRAEEGSQGLKSASAPHTVFMRVSSRMAHSRSF